MVGEDIPPVENDNFKFLGMPVHFYKDNNAARTFLKQMLASIEEVPLTRQQKLCMGRLGQIIEHLYIFPPSEERWVGRGVARILRRGVRHVEQSVQLSENNCRFGISRLYTG